MTTTTNTNTETSEQTSTPSPTGTNETTQTNAAASAANAQFVQVPAEVYAQFMRDIRESHIAKKVRVMGIHPLENLGDFTRQISADSFGPRMYSATDNHSNFSVNTPKWKAQQRRDIIHEENNFR